MTVSDLIQLAGSLVAVLFVAWLVKRMGLGADPRIADAAHAIRLADEAETGFGGVEVARDRAGFLGTFCQNFVHVALVGDDKPGRLILDQCFCLLDVGHLSCRKNHTQRIAQGIDRHMQLGYFCPKPRLY